VQRVAAGHDFGRMRVAGGLDNVLVDLGDVSTLEQLMLAETRMYHIIVKVVSPTEDQGAARVRLKSNTIVFPDLAEAARRSGAPADDADLAHWEPTHGCRS